MQQLRTSNAKGPCLNCKDRKIGCHGKNEDESYICGKYGEFKEARIAENEYKAKRICENNDVYCAKSYRAKIKNRRK